jgi:hypothetical protein
MRNRTKVALVAGLSALALVGIGTGAAFAATSGPAAPTTTASSTPASPSTPSTTKAHKGKSLLARAEHGELTLKNKVIDVQRGQVTSVSATSVTVKSADGFTATYVVNSGTKVHKDKQASAITNVANGDRIRIRATKNGNTDTATRIGDAGPAPAGH